MPKFRFDKLVRDKIVEHQITSGAKPKFRQLTDEEHKEELVKKIIEEVTEITKAKPEEITGEIADVQQAIDDLKEKFGITSKEVEAAQEVKNEKNGAFKKGHFIEYVELDENDEWNQYYRENADRYPEIS